jgi:predicted transcriptional regulator of viral defense system
MSSLRRVKSSVRRSKPTLLCRHRYSATASISLSIRGGEELYGLGGGARPVSGLWGLSLVEKGLARRLKRGTYLIERRAVEEVLTALKEWI